MSLRQPIKLIRYISGLSDAGLKPSLETSLGQVAISCEAISTFYAEDDLNFNILSLLSLHESGSKLVQKYGNPKIPVNDKYRNKIINIALGHVVKAIGNYYLKSSTMEKLAEAIVKAFPQMGFTRARLPSHAYIYNSATANAFLDQHLKRMRNAALSDKLATVTFAILYPLLVLADHNNTLWVIVCPSLVDENITSRISSLKEPVDLSTAYSLLRLH
ncbi:hypothetical protein DAPPUDRAFT_332914 [Daphnia pulex]|uniref:Uncharacterized protein n=1 Tax=Daphnia pulex TaxID=6669 RepID=E9HRA9_DAPPU|nr:hypothetical protein DAPPUDRAFT_332914 [Daphnia pulex]|eukprot:EFX65730.1 hypothetical protein DAPPUDRAFT_332914 [Daphnia pulex]